MRELDAVIREGMIFDGTAGPRYRADIGIKDGVIAEIGRIPASRAVREIDASGLHVAPGFVDTHTHYDAQLFWDPYCSLSGWHGVTTAVIGNCGFGFAPVAPEFRDRAMQTMTRVEAIPYAAMKAGLPWDWETFPEFLDSVERTHKAVNLAPCVPLAPMLITVMGFDRAKAGELPTDAEHAALQEMLRESMNAGGIGWSAQVLPLDGPAPVQRDFDGGPMVTDVMHLETACALAEVLAERNEGSIQLTVGLAGENGETVQFYERVAEISGRSVIFNVVQGNVNNPSQHTLSMQWLASCRERGLKIVGQSLTTRAGFTFTLDEWNLYDDNDAWCEVTLGNIEERLEKMADPKRRPALRELVPMASTVSVEDVMIAETRSPRLKEFEGLTCSEAAKKLGVPHPVDAMLDIAVRDKLQTTFYGESLNHDLDVLREIVADPHLMPGVSDGGAHTKFITVGRFPTEFLTELVRENQMCTLEQAHYRLSALPARTVGLEDRGTLEVGKAADIVIYDYENLAIEPMEVAHDFPGDEWRRVQRASGYRYVLVNGDVTIEDDKETRSYSGRLLRHGRT
ncbi:MAG: amidohydrolase family protein [Myxococcales bacterium]|nr:amidohydrolase family protein [Myxococcales bacterium]